MTYKFTDNLGTFRVNHPQKVSSYFPLTNKRGTLLSAIGPNLAGDIKSDNDHFITVPASIEDLKHNLLCRREFFIKIASPQDPSESGLIRLSKEYNDSLEAGFLYHKIIKQTPLLDIDVTNFIPFDLDAEVMLIRVTNNSKKKITIRPTSFVPLFGRSEKNLRDHRHVSSLLNRIELEGYGLLLKPSMIFNETGHRENTTIYYGLGFEGEKIQPIGQFPSIDYFCGENDLFSPDAINDLVKPIKKTLPCFNGKEVCVSLRFRDKDLAPSESVEYALIFGISESKIQIKKTFQKLNSVSKINDYLNQTKAYWISYLSSLSFNFQKPDYDNWLLWVKLQPTLRKLFGNSFLPHFDYGKGGRGWRDLWQDALTLLFTEEKDAKKLILKSFQGVRIDGSNATIITKKGDFIADRNQISRVWMDHGVWPYLTLKLYIHRTGDIKILEKNIPYFQDHQFRRGKEINQKGKHPDNYLRTNQNKIYHGSLLEHLLIQNVVQFFNVGRHNCTLLENADWNDGLDMAADKGESVTFSFMYAHNLLDLCSLLTRLKAVSSSVLLAKGLFTLFDSLKNPIDYNNYKARRALLDEYFAQQNNFSGDRKKVAIDDLISDLSKKANHSFNWLTKKEWLKEGFFNGYYDNHSRRVEGKFNNKVSLLLPSQVFPIFSEAATKDQIKSVWKSLKKHLIDKKLSGIRLNTDFGKNCLNLGRAFGFAYGDKENGAFFNHMSILLAYALYKRDFNEQGYEIFNSIYQMASSKTAKTYPIIPEYFNSDGRGLYLYLTGSASWYIYTLFERVLGIEFVFGDLQISPRINSKNFTTSTISVTFNYCHKLLTITFHKSPKSKTSKTLSVTAITLNGKAIDLQNNKIVLTRSEITKIPTKNLSIDINLI